MFSRQRNRILVAGLLIGASACWSAFVLTRPFRGFVPFVASPLPQLAIGDFDGDGRPDLARIDDHRDSPRDISVGLSESSDAVHLPTAVVALIDGDVDQDGDLDLLAATASGEVLVWVNDGHGRFTQRQPAQQHGIAGDPVVTSGDASELVTVTSVAPVFAARTAAEAVRRVAQARAPAAPLIGPRYLLLLHGLRAPPVRLS